nr:hypothetical protein [Streptococcus uberis]
MDMVPFYLSNTILGSVLSFSSAGNLWVVSWSSIKYRNQHKAQNKSSFILSLNSSNIQLGQAIGLSIAVLVIKAFGIQNLTLLTLSSALLVLMIASLLKERN